ncbi:hypothetical protein Tsp_08692 [Trichinella spiralis]|uniref:hypothetical protein n=1 Tax=Trichinella spiralis TaxID=6334 RepID=UPI0001EFDF38|nr:hypothetical protein Tsp_08692 [Trichinella spiralis]
MSTNVNATFENFHVKEAEILHLICYIWAIQVNSDASSNIIVGIINSIISVQLPLIFRSSVKKFDKVTSSISPIVKRSSYKTSEVHAACTKQMEIKYKFYVILLLQRASLLRKRFAASKLMQPHVGLKLHLQIIILTNSYFCSVFNQGNSANKNLKHFGCCKHGNM